MDIAFKFDPEIIIGADTLAMAGTVCRRYGERVMIAADNNVEPQTVMRLKEILMDSRIEAIVFEGINENSNVDLAENIVDLGKAGHCNAIIGIGGQKAQVIARMAAIMAPEKIGIFELLEGRQCNGNFLPLIAIPTTSLDPFSLTEYFVAPDPRDKKLKYIHSPNNLYAAMIIDNTLLNFLSGPSAAASLFEGFFMATEAYCSARANFLSDAILERALNFYAKLIKSGAGGISADTFAQAVFLASLGNAISSPGIGSALSLAISARYPEAKQSCAAALLPVIAKRLVNARPEKMARVASFLGGAGKPASVADAANTAIDNIQKAMTALKVRSSLKEFNISMDKVAAAAETARNLEFIANSPWTVSGEDIFNILQQIL